jgi:hypothetical protein
MRMGAVYNIVVHTDDTGALIVGAIGVVLAVGSLLWQAWTFLRSGSRVRVEARDGFRRAGIGAVATIAKTASAEEAAHLRDQGFTERVLAVHVSNAGRGSTSVVSVDLVFNDGGSVASAAQDPPLPFRLEGESEQAWYMEAQLAQRYAAAMQIERPTVRAEVRLGGRKKALVSKREIAL